MNPNSRKAFSLSLFLAAILVQALPSEAQDFICTELNSFGIPFSQDAEDIAIVGNTAYLAANSDGLLIYDISNPRKPQLRGQFKYYGINAKGVALNGNYAYLANDDDGLTVVDISAPRQPTLTRHVQTPDDAFSITISGSYLYLSTDDYNLQIYNIANPALPGLIKTWSTSRYIYNVCIAGNYAYLANSRDGLQILNISHPATPIQVGNYNTDGYVYDVEVHGNYAYLADQGGGLQIIDISSANLPAYVGSYETDGDAYEVDVIGDYAYVAVDYETLEVIDISNKSNPTLAAAPEGNESARAIAVSSNFAYLCTGSSTLVFDVSDPTAPVLEDRYVPNAETSASTSSDELIFLGTSSPGSLQIFDASDASDVSYVGGCILTGNVSTVTICDDYAYVCGYEGMLIVDISDPANPFEAAFVAEKYYIHEAVIRPPYAYLCDRGLRIMDIMQSTCTTRYLLPLR